MCACRPSTSPGHQCARACVHIWASVPKAGVHCVRYQYSFQLCHRNTQQMDMDFGCGPLLGTFHFVKRKSHSARAVLNMAPGTDPTLKSTSLESLTIVLNLCSQLSILCFLLTFTSKALNPTPLPLMLDSYTLLHHP